MRLLIVTQFYPPELGAPQTRLSELARRLRAAGDDVEVITCMPNYPTGVIPKEYRGKLYVEEVREGVRIHRSWVYPAPNRGFLKRIANHLSFAVTSIPASFRCARPDLVFVESPPLVLGLAGWVIGLLRRVPFVLNVSDLFTDSAVALGILRDRWAIGASDRLERFIYSRAAGVVALTEGIEQGVLRRVAPEKKVRLIRGSVDLARFGDADGADWRKRHGITQSFVAVYAGTHGSSQGLPSLVEAARELEDQSQIVVVMVGEGALKSDLERAAEGLQNVMFLPSQPPEAMPEVLAGADVCIVPLKDIPLFVGSLPSKLFEAMAAGRAIVLAAPAGEASRLVLLHGSGVAVPAEDPAALAAALRRLAADPVSVREMGVQGRLTAERYFSREVMTGHIRSFLQEVIDEGGKRNDEATNLRGAR
jgi:glycosyltransferase involved in cell wall biosynthesis